MRFALVLCALLLAGCAAPAHDDDPPRQDAPSPYAGQETREIKALSRQDVDGYRKGAGLGYAKSAELNHYPGPLHVLELADKLELTPEQRAAAQRLREEMLANAVPWGEAYLRAEADVEEAFRSGNVTEEILRALIEKAADIEAELRLVHLKSHIEMRRILTPEQVLRYDELRGYGGDAHAHDGAH